MDLSLGVGDNQLFFVVIIWVLFCWGVYNGMHSEVVYWWYHYLLCRMVGI